MKQYFSKIAAILMAFIVVFSTVSFTVSEHYCGEKLVNSAVFSKAESCGMDMQKTSFTDDCNIQKDNCCNDVVKLVKGQSDLKVDFPDFTLKQQFFVVAFTYTYQKIFEDVSSKVFPLKNYPLPLVDRDLNVLYQTFRI
ncbi:HYC_CC_PP family protein [Lutibacter sp.]